MDKIIYTLVSNGGGIDGRDHTDKGGDIIAASYDKATLERHKGKPWATIHSEVVDVEAAQKRALAKLSPVDKLVLEGVALNAKRK